MNNCSKANIKIDTSVPISKFDLRCFISPLDTRMMMKLISSQQMVKEMEESTALEIR